ncbi:MAG: D-alanyl-D-alanine carboxypeptidase family protein [Castellaniella sp.]|uniref:D-alanyl-D-alanine carboxypeptidase family protein n=1 Tax=Castellaniella sp. TaxID=1955812 RepID=UPI002A35D6C4|nr:D-alanyl-D-alanine carboxypeptidase family protein [Castellaniella sp.]MDY0310055.1 D-alanyl-D-alanine carboxypeptidase family protein [Castellaniella sp.]
MPMNAFSSLFRRACVAPLVLACLLLMSGAAWSQAASGPAAESAAGQAQAGVDMVSNLTNIPAPTLGAKAWLTLDATSGQIIAAQNPQEAVEPASLTKLMSAYVIFEALEGGRLKLDQKVHVSEKAWKTEGSRMFIDPNTDVSVDELLQGMLVQSGNDATVALAEAVAGSESAFVALMNQQAKALGMKHTHFTNAPGLPDPDHMTTVEDLGILARALVQRFPQYRHYDSQKEFTYNKIKQSNRNRLLWADPTVDGLKTGHTQSAGYCLVATALRDGRRVVSVLVGAASDAARTESSLKLLNWSFKNFDTVKLLDKGKPAVSARVWEGTSETAELGLSDDLWVTVPRGRADDIKTEARYTQPLMAPLAEHAQAGTLVISLDGQEIEQRPLVVLQAVDQAGFFGRLLDKIRLLFE